MKDQLSTLAQAPVKTSHYKKSFFLEKPSNLEIKVVDFGPEIKLHFSKNGGKQYLCMRESEYRSFLACCDRLEGAISECQKVIELVHRQNNIPLQPRNPEYFEMIPHKEQEVATPREPGMKKKRKKKKVNEEDTQQSANDPNTTDQQQQQQKKKKKKNRRKKAKSQDSAPSASASASDNEDGTVKRQQPEGSEEVEHASDSDYFSQVEDNDDDDTDAVCDSGEEERTNAKKRARA